MVSSVLQSSMNEIRRLKEELLTEIRKLREGGYEVTVWSDHRPANQDTNPVTPEKYDLRVSVKKTTTYEKVL